MYWTFEPIPGKTVISFSLSSTFYLGRHVLVVGKSNEGQYQWIVGLSSFIKKILSFLSRQWTPLNSSFILPTYSLSFYLEMGLTIFIDFPGSSPLDMVWLSQLFYNSLFLNIFGGGLFRGCWSWDANIIEMSILSSF